MFYKDDMYKCISIDEKIAFVSSIARYMCM